MRRVKQLALVAAALALLASPLAEACGDKLLSIARGIRLQQAYKARHPATIVMFVKESAAGGSAHDNGAFVQMSILYMSLRQAGHRISLAGNARELADALRENVDFLITDIGDADAVRQALQAGGASGTIRPASSGPAAPKLVPVLFKPHKADLAAASKAYDLVLKTPATSTEHLEAIDRAMKARSERPTPGI